jgi:hypothetical protein
MNNRLEEFLQLCVCLTGFDRLRLLGTSMTEAYPNELDAILGAELLDELLSVFGGPPRGEALESAISTRILADPRLGPVARNIVVMWYCGTWKMLPQDWRAAYGTLPRDTDHVVSAMAYLSGLQWTVISAHPPGGFPQGFASWSSPAKGGER